MLRTVETSTPLSRPHHFYAWVAAVLLLVFLCSSFAQASTAAALTGNWRGTWIRHGDALPVTMSFTAPDDKEAGSFSSDALQVVNIPITQRSSDGDKVHFEIKGDASTTIFDGTIKNNVLTGTFVDGDAKGTFQLTRTKGLTTPSVRSHDITFRNGSVSLSGTLLLPLSPGKYPAILFLQGSGPEGRWANHYLAQKFAEAGFVALIYDKRGVGQSTGDWRNAGFDALAEDASAGVSFLQSHPQVDATHVGIYGHSQGGTIAPLVANRIKNLAFVIASAAGGVDPATVETYSLDHVIDLDKLAPAEQTDAQRYVKAVVDVAYRGADRTSLDKLAAQLKDRSWFFAAPPPEASYWSISRQIASFDPAMAWKQVNAPVLLLYGAHDERIPSMASIAAINAALKAGGHAPPTVKLYPDADHTFTLVGPEHANGWPKHEPDYVTTLLSWAANRVDERFVKP